MLARARMFRASIIAMLLGTLSTPIFAADCQVAKIADLPVTMLDMQPMGTAKINGTDVGFVVDSGAFYSIISPASAAELQLKLSPAPYGLGLRGVNGGVAVSVATVKKFTIAGADVKDVQFLVGGSQVGGASVGVLGQNVLHIGDVEYDLAKGVIKLLSLKGCANANLAYWAGSTQPYSVMDINYSTAIAPHTIGVAYLNGKKIRVIFDTGAPTSIITLRAAEAAGVTPKTAGVSQGGTTYGFGKGMVRTWIAPFNSFKIGDEEIQHTHLRIGAVDLDTEDMLLGADFFLSHHIYVSNKQRKLYFTYNGGPVFNLAVAARPTDQPVDVDVPKTAADFSRRGTASSARQDYAGAIADLTRASELAPLEPNYVYERGLAYEHNGQPELAQQDMDHAIDLKSDHIPARLARAELAIQSGHRELAQADLDAADQAASKEADARLRMAFAYKRIGNAPKAITQLDQWIAAHGEDARVVEALNSRCWMKAQLGIDLSKALADCDAALRLAGRTAASSAIYDSRALVRLRQGEYKKSIVDYDASLKLNPKNAWSLYGRGMAKSRSVKATGSDDMAAAIVLEPRIAGEFAEMNILP